MQVGVAGSDLYEAKSCLREELLCILHSDQRRSQEWQRGPISVPRNVLEGADDQALIVPTIMLLQNANHDMKKTVRDAREIKTMRDPEQRLQGGKDVLIAIQITAALPQAIRLEK